MNDLSNFSEESEVSSRTGIAPAGAGNAETSGDPERKNTGAGDLERKNTGSGVPDNAGDSSGDKDSKDGSSRMDVFDWLQCIVTALVCGIFIFVFIGRTIGVDGRSMLQTLHHHDRVVMSNLFFTPKFGDIIIFHSSAADFGGTPLVKRVIAVAGQTVDIDFGTNEVFVDGKLIDEPYINEPTAAREDFTGPVTVPEGCVFVMGDNRNNSSDSRDRRVGMVDTRFILGKVLFLLIPGSDSTYPRDWSRFGLIYH